ncbi:hypothetical protein F4561_001528 [Lipingzhangella halophila]|uniref:DUF5753 domain-containing protein n=1 Tax=Lipingzhangella halophila TaxID=1783352 RepID=A0A7W7REU8_9ACTN|nr:helix-turn-helix transcriptional regulator [Lipingzhangella halophila]MBB4930708.1 hypothetical protein [Lipingzhangella halophila]
MSSTERPTVARWELAKRLRALRGDRSFNEVVKAVRTAASSLSRWENPGEGGAVPGQLALERLLEHYEVDQETWDRMVELRKEAKVPGWWQSLDVAEYYGTFMALEEAATNIRTWQSQLVPGLLQTEDYARAIFRADNSDRPPEMVEHHMRIRAQRQERWRANENGPHLWAIISEAAIRPAVGGPTVMAHQLHHLVEMAEHHRVTLQVLPFSVGTHAGMVLSSFVILRLDDDLLSTVHLEGQGANLFLDTKDDLIEYGARFNKLRAAALGTAATSDFLAKIAKDLEKEADS